MQRPFAEPVGGLEGLPTSLRVDEVGRGDVRKGLAGLAGRIGERARGVPVQVQRTDTRGPVPQREGEHRALARGDRRRSEPGEPRVARQIRDGDRFAGSECQQARGEFVRTTRRRPAKEVRRRSITLHYEVHLDVVYCPHLSFTNTLTCNDAVQPLSRNPPSSASQADSAGSIPVTRSMFVQVRALRRLCTARRVTVDASSLHYVMERRGTAARDHAVAHAPNRLMLALLTIADLRRCTRVRNAGIQLSG